MGDDGDASPEAAVAMLERVAQECRQVVPVPFTFPGGATKTLPGGLLIWVLSPGGIAHNLWVGAEDEFAHGIHHLLGAFKGLYAVAVIWTDPDWPGGEPLRNLLEDPEIRHFHTLSDGSFLKEENGVTSIVANFWPKPAPRTGPIEENHWQWLSDRLHRQSAPAPVPARASRLQARLLAAVQGDFEDRYQLYQEIVYRRSQVCIPLQASTGTPIIMEWPGSGPHLPVFADRETVQRYISDSSAPTAAFATADMSSAQLLQCAQENGLSLAFLAYPRPDAPEYLPIGAEEIASLRRGILPDTPPAH